MPREGLFLTYINMQPTGPRDTTMVTPFLAPLIILYGSGAGKWRPEQGKEKSEVRRLALQKQAAATVSAYPMMGMDSGFRTRVVGAGGYTQGLSNSTSAALLRK
jgi:hypothetical protein